MMENFHSRRVCFELYSSPKLCTSTNVISHHTASSHRPLPALQLRSHHSMQLCSPCNLQLLPKLGITTSDLGRISLLPNYFTDWTIGAASILHYSSSSSSKLDLSATQPDFSSGRDPKPERAAHRMMYDMIVAGELALPPCDSLPVTLLAALSLHLPAISFSGTVFPKASVRVPKGKQDNGLNVQIFFPQLSVPTSRPCQLSDPTITRDAPQ